MLIVGADGRGREFFDSALIESIAALQRSQSSVDKHPKSNFELRSFAR